MRPDEARDTATLLGKTATSIARTVRRTQEGVTDATYQLVEAAIGPAVVPVRHVQRGLTRGVYAAVEVGLTVASGAAGHVAAARARERAARSDPAPGRPGGEPPVDAATGDAAPLDGPPLDGPPLDGAPVDGTRINRDTAEVTPGGTASVGLPAAVPLIDDPRTRRWLAALNGVVGDRLIPDDSTLALPMTLREGGTDVAPTRSALAAAYGTGNRRLAVFVHGVVEDETCWAYRESRMPQGRPTTLPALLTGFGHQPLCVRYNSGVSIATNGERLSALITTLVAAWPGDVTEIVFVGHSMGGLLVHIALDGADPSWADLVTRVITLGSPADGAPLARWAGTVAKAATTIPQALWLDDVLRLRSQGMADLANAAGPFPAASHARRLLVHGSLSRWSHPLADRFGDGMVPVPRHLIGAEAATVGDPVAGSPPPRDTVVVLPGLGHQALLNHPTVHDAVAGWLDA